MHGQGGPSHIVVLTTLETADQARTLVRQLVDRRVIACGTVFANVISLYRWKGTVEEATETQVLLKTRRERWGDLQAAVRELHPYEVPELLALPVEGGLSSYLEWVAEETIAEGGDSA
jgi:periplasmic divalent cation tolerance protein